MEFKKLCKGIFSAQNVATQIRNPAIKSIDRRRIWFTLSEWVVSIIVIKSILELDSIYELGHWVTGSTNGLTVKPHGQIKKFKKYIYIYIYKFEKL